MSNSATLLETLGGLDGVRHAITDLYDRILGDDQIARFFDDVDLIRLRNHMSDFLLAAITGSTDGYHGRPLDVAHRGLGIGDDDFDRVGSHLVAVISDATGDDELAAQVGNLIAPLRPAVIDL